MPIYEYRCQGCHRRVSLFAWRVGGDEDAACPRCGSRRLERVWSRFAYVRSEEDRLERLSDPAMLGGVEEDDPQSVARFMRRMGKELGEEAADELDDLAERVESGDAGEDALDRDEPASSASPD